MANVHPVPQNFVLALHDEILSYVGDQREGCPLLFMKEIHFGDVQVACVTAWVSELGNLGSGTFPFPFSPREVFPFPSALQGPIQLQLALSV